MGTDWQMFGGHCTGTTNSMGRSDSLSMLPYLNFSCAACFPTLCSTQTLTLYVEFAFKH